MRTSFIYKLIRILKNIVTNDYLETGLTFRKRVLLLLSGILGEGKLGECYFTIEDEVLIVGENMFIFNSIAYSVLKGKWSIQDINNL